MVRYKEKMPIITIPVALSRQLGVATVFILVTPSKSALSAHFIIDNEQEVATETTVGF